MTLKIYTLGCLYCCVGLLQRAGKVVDSLGIEMRGVDLNTNLEYVLGLSCLKLEMEVCLNRSTYSWVF